jgi:hypothetical protein
VAFDTMDRAKILETYNSFDEMLQSLKAENEAME